MAYEPEPTPTPPRAGPGGVGPGVPDPGVRPTLDPPAGPGTPQTQPRTGGAIGAAGEAVGGLLDSLNPFSDLTDSLSAVRRWVSDRHNWVRVSWVVGGASMFTVGVIMMAGRPVGKTAGAAVQLVTPAGKAVKAAKAVGKAS